MGVISTDASKSVEELVAQAKSWTIVGKDLLSEVRVCVCVWRKPLEGGGESETRVMKKGGGGGCWCLLQERGGVGEGVWVGGEEAGGIDWGRGAKV